MMILKKILCSSQENIMDFQKNMMILQKNIMDLSRKYDDPLKKILWTFKKKDERQKYDGPRRTVYDCVMMYRARASVATLL